MVLLQERIMFDEKKPREEVPVAKKAFDRDLILVVDDDRDIVAAIVESLEKDLPSARFLTTGNGNDAVSIFEKNVPKPGIIILDMMLPGRSGFLVMKKIKRGKRATDVPHIIMITGNQQKRHKMYAESMGTFGYLNKPFRMQRLLEVVQDARSRIS